MGPQDRDSEAQVLTWGSRDARALGSRSAHRRRDAGTPMPDPLAGSLLVQFLRAPALVGGIVPSSPFLARTMSRHAAGFDAIVELGGGTGAVTRRLARDHPLATLTVIEREPALARRLAAACPHAHVRIGCVHEREPELAAQPGCAVAVSSLPFRSLPADVAERTMLALQRFLLAHERRRLVQYSYGLRAPFAFRDARIVWHRVERVWRNVPPALVWVASLPV
jgi:phospholipid N-methyltransferase